MSKEFEKKWKSTDGWRGYYEVTPKKGTGWKHKESGWSTGEWEDAGENAGSKVKAKLHQMKLEARKRGYELKVVHSPTSNGFSTGYDVFERKRKGESGTVNKKEEIAEKMK